MAAASKAPAGDAIRAAIDHSGIAPATQASAASEGAAVVARTTAYNEAAERYFAEFPDPAFLLNKPFSDTHLAAKHLIVAFAVVLVVARVTDEKLRVDVQIETGARQRAVLRESRAGQTPAEDVGRQTEKTRHRGVIIQSVCRFERADAASGHIEQ